MCRAILRHIKSMHCLNLEWKCLHTQVFLISTTLTHWINKILKLWGLLVFQEICPVVIQLFRGLSGSLGVSRGLSGRDTHFFTNFFWLKALEASLLSNQIMKIYSCFVHSFVLYSSDTFFLVLAFKLFFTLKDLQHLFTGYKLNLKLCQSQNWHDVCYT